MIRSLTISLAALVLGSCSAAQDHAAREQRAKQIATGAGMHYQTLRTTSFGLSSYQRIRDPQQPMTVYIEGDGYAWAAADLPSRDPTPVVPVALELAARDPSPDVIYLARPCQYSETASPQCEPRYWTSARFAPEVIRAYDEALTQLKATTGTPGFHLVGFSGGGAVALLLASQRQDILSVRTVAGNIDHKQWTNLHEISPLSESLNAADAAQALAVIPQLHFVGADDAVMPIAVADAYRQRFHDPRCVRVVTVPDAAHTTGWENQWPQLLKMSLPCQEERNPIKQ